MSIREWLAVYCIGILLLPGCATRQIDLSARPESNEETRHRQAFASEPQLRAVFGSPHQSILAQGLSPSEEVESSLARARQLLISGRHTEAILLLSRLDEKGENSREILLALAEAWMHSGNLALAESYAKRAFELYGKDAEVTLILGEIQFTKGEIYRAEESFESVYRTHPDDVRVLRWMATCRFQQEDWPIGRSYLERAIALEPSDALLREMLAKALVHLGEEDRAKDQLLAVLPTAQALDKLGAIYLEGQNWEDARRVLRIALSVDGTLASARVNLQEAESHLAPPAVVNLSSFRDYQQERAALLLRLEQERATMASRHAGQATVQGEHPELSEPTDAARQASGLHQNLNRIDFPLADTVSLRPGTTNLQTAAISVEQGFSLRNGVRSGGTGVSAGGRVNTGRDADKAVSMEPTRRDIREELGEVALDSPQEVADDASDSHLLEGTIVTVTVHTPKAADGNRYLKTIDRWEVTDATESESPSFESLTLAGIDSGGLAVSDAALPSSEMLLITGRADETTVEPVSFGRDFASSVRHSLQQWLEPKTIDLAWPAQEGELPVAETQIPVAVIDLFKPEPVIQLMSLPRKVAVRGGETISERVDRHSAPNFPGFDLRLDESVQSEAESRESRDAQKGSANGFWGVVGAVALMLLMILLI